jgi:hypothetical protein
LSGPTPGEPASSYQPIADIAFGRIVVPSAHFPYLRAIQVDTDRHLGAGVAHPVDAPATRQDCRGPVLPVPPQLPDFLQTSVVEHRAVIEAFVALFEHRSHHAAICSPGGVIVDVSSASLRPDEDLQRVGAILALAALGHVPVFDYSRCLQEGKDACIQEGRLPHQMGQVGGSALEGQLRGKVGKLLKFVGIW